MAPPSLEALLEHYDFDPNRLERIAFRRSRPALAIVEPDASWPQAFNLIKARIESALGPVCLSVAHVGSTSVLGLPAKPVIDIDLVVRDVTDEASYADKLEAVGFQFLTREPTWHEHRFFCGYEPLSTNLHVWGPECPETARHAIFTSWLRRNEADRELYARTKREMAKLSNEKGETVMEYNRRKEEVIREILKRAFKDLGYL
ncbi:grpb/dephospho-CoA kinase [Dactylonectria estremocensis]|uniref:Grpb/dephospho-CoA kinase n=1 Tax=Dactylonectria estremocensis TaxID=1079267 RepID=A0A9P9J780_9HYPO|nr:grpb/dephospho-CoA kinase [Dactylonectria estremocensis]